MIDLNPLIKEISELDNEKKIIEVKNIFTKKNVSPLYAKLKEAEDKKEYGQQLNKLKDEIDNIINKRLEELVAKQDNVEISDDIVLDIDTFRVGNTHIINQVIDDILSYLSQFDFALVSGNEVTTDHYNFQALNIGKDHPARNMHDSLFINANYLLRTHCTSTTAIYLNKQNESDDIRVVSYGNVYRKDEDDATHSHQFTQIDLVWVRNDLNFANLKFIINGLIQHLFGKSLDVRYRLSYFPFTEPSFEVDVECWKCKNKGCNICKHTGWIEILGAGMLNQKVIDEAGIKNINSGLAAGIGVERIAMLKYGITDIRDFYNNDFDILKQFSK